MGKVNKRPSYETLCFVFEQRNPRPKDPEIPKEGWKDVQWVEWSRQTEKLVKWEECKEEYAKGEWW